MVLVHATRGPAFPVCIYLYNTSCSMVRLPPVICSPSSLRSGFSLVTLWTIAATRHHLYNMTFSPANSTPLYESFRLLSTLLDFVTAGPRHSAMTTGFSLVLYVYIITSRVSEYDRSPLVLSAPERALRQSPTVFTLDQV